MHEIPYITVVTITYDNLEGIKRTYASIKRQTFQNIEWIVVNGNPGDETSAFLKTTDFPLNTFIEEKDNGIFDAMNKGLSKASGVYISFLNSGDTYATTKTLDDVYKAAQSNPDFIYGDSYELTPSTGSHIYKTAYPQPDIIWGVLTHHPAMFFKRSHLEEHNITYNENYTVASDYDFMVRTLQNTDSIAYTQTPLAVYELGGFSRQHFYKSAFDLFNIRRHTKLVPLWRNLQILITHLLSWQLRAIAPQFHKKLKALVTS
jgi:putative colanic acid biosynthesis glycosyltransferase